MKRRVYLMEGEIIAAIDRATERLQQGRKRCADLEKQIRKLQKKSAKGKNVYAELSECEAKLTRLTKRSRTLEDSTLPRLKRTLAAFRTRTFPFMGTYQGVVAA